MSTAHELDPSQSDDPFSSEYWGDVITVVKAERTPIYNLPNARTVRAAKIMLSNAQTALLSGAINPPSEVPGFRFHPEYFQPGDTFLYDIERLSEIQKKLPTWIPYRYPKSRLAHVELVSVDPLELLNALQPADSLHPVNLELTEYSFSDLTQTTRAYQREVGLGIVIGEPARRALLTFKRELFTNNVPTYSWIISNDPGIVGYSTKRVDNLFGQPREITERVRSIKHLPNSAETFGLIQDVQSLGKTGLRAVR